MAGDPHEYKPSGFMNRVKGIGVGFALLAIGKDLERIGKLGDLALDLARNNPDDEQCVRQLIEAAGRDHENLGRAWASLLDEVEGVPESRTAERAIRLLQAASTGQPVVSISPEADDLLTRIQRLMSVRVEEAYPELVELMPDLRGLEHQFAPRTLTDSDKDAVWAELIRALDPMIGPKATEPGPADPLLRTRNAYNVVRLFFALRVGLLAEVEYD